MNRLPLNTKIHAVKTSLGRPEAIFCLFSNDLFLEARRSYLIEFRGFRNRKLEGPTERYSVFIRSCTKSTYIRRYVASNVTFCKSLLLLVFLRLKEGKIWTFSEQGSVFMARALILKGNSSAPNFGVQRKNMIFFCFFLMGVSNMIYRSSNQPYLWHTEVIHVKNAAKVQVWLVQRCMLILHCYLKRITQIFDMGFTCWVVRRRLAVCLEFCWVLLSDLHPVWRSQSFSIEV